METRNLDFGIEMTDEQWRALERTADSLGETRGFDAARSVEQPFSCHAIQVFMDGTRGPDAWRDYLTSPEGTYGTGTAEVAAFHFNGGRPFASIDVPPRLVDEPAVPDTVEQQMQRELEAWVRNRWHKLLEVSGLHYDRGHIPQSGSAEEEEFR